MKRSVNAWMIVASVGFATAGGLMVLAALMLAHAGVWWAAALAGLSASLSAQQLWSVWR